VLTQLALGAEVDIATGDELRDGVADLKHTMLSEREAKPIYLTRVQSEPGTGHILYVIGGGPPVGRIWYLTSITVVGNNDVDVLPPTSPASYVALYAGFPPPRQGLGDFGSPGLGQLKAVRLPIPSTTAFNAGSVWCQSNQSLFVRTSDVVNAPDSVTVIMEIQEFREKDVSQRSGA
jgi:hypothetical protein